MLITPAMATELHVVTEDAYPIQYQQQGKVVGPSTELLEAVLSRAGVSYDIKVLPWARAYNTALQHPNTLIYSIARTGEREALFKWGGSLMQLTYSLYGRNGISIAPDTPIAELNKYRIGIIRQSALHQYLLSKGVTNFYLVGTGRQNIKKLLAGRVDLIPANDTSFRLSCLNIKADCRGIRAVLPLKEPSTELYFAFSRATPDELVLKVRNAYQQIMHESAVSTSQDAISLQAY